MLLQETGYLHETGIEYEAQGVLWFTFRDARIQSIREYLNVQAR
jgi:ketosteroid isomerase-like protein